LGKLCRLVWHIAVGWWTIKTRFKGMTEVERQARVQAWSAQLLAVLGVQLVVRGQPPKSGPMLLVANHISWLDIAVLHAARYCRFVAKSQIKTWPVVGSLATGIGTLYVARESRRDAMRVVHHMADALRAGDVLAIFPEGTTSDGSGLLAFHANLFQATIAAQTPVQPLSLDYQDAASGARSRATAYVGDDSLQASLWQTLTAPPLRVVVNFGQAQVAEGRDRRAFAHDMQQAVAALRGDAASGHTAHGLPPGA
jgi:1-acyl-sn-glycerol-3-phosphate acyltransferase